MKLKELLHAIPVIQVEGTIDLDIKTLCFDSREVTEDSLFVAVKGVQTDGHLYINQVIENGGRVLVVEKLPKLFNDDITYIVVDDTTFVLGLLASNFYKSPSKDLKLVGVTGTNGKTTVATLLYNLFERLGYKVGLLSTVENRIHDTIVPATHTTPNPIAINSMLREMVDEGCDFCFMEVSSHAIAQQRIAGLRFAGGVFTNITHDHLDYHKTFDNYINVKKMFFDNLDKHAFALTNVDNKNGSRMVQNTFGYRKTFALKNDADFKARIIESHFDGMLLQIDGNEVWVRLVGGFNAYNVLAVYASAILLEQETEKVLTALSEISGARGRFETLQSMNGVFGIVDYAHTPDAIENVLITIRQVKKTDQRVITVIGCGGDRDKAKRPEMAKVAAIYSDKVILTSDNPRTEDPLGIIKEMEVGIPIEKRKNCFSISDRKEAIRAAFHLASAGDIVLVAGKGHERYQEVNKVRHYFDDKEELEKIFNEN